MTMTNDPHDILRRGVLASVLDGPADTDAALRHAVAGRSGVPADLTALVEKIHAHAYRVTDADVTVPASARGEDAMFELIVAASIGAAEERLAAGLRALEQA